LLSTPRTILIPFAQMTDPKDLLAAERTLLAWIRTGIALMGFGFVVARFGLFLRELAQVGGHVATQRFDGALIGAVVAASGVVVNVWATLRHATIVRRMREGDREIGAAGPIAVGLVSGLGGVLLVGVILDALLR
jgi:putative membrane protein